MNTVSHNTLKKHGISGHHCMDPAHRDILRNEQADREAKRGKSKSSPIDTGIGVEVRKSIIKKSHRREVERAMENMHKGRGTIFRHPQRTPSKESNKREH